MMMGLTVEQPIDLTRSRLVYRSFGLEISQWFFGNVDQAVNFRDMFWSVDIGCVKKLLKTN